MTQPINTEIGSDLNEIYVEFRNSTFQLFENLSTLQKPQITSSSLASDNLTQTSETTVQSNTQMEEFYAFLQEFFQKIIEVWSSQVLPAFFDIVIETALFFARKLLTDPIFPLNTIYNFFYLLGMRKILVKTIKRITGAIQWGVVSSTWVNIPFWLTIYGAVPDTEIEKEAKSALEEMIMTAQMMQADRLRISRTLSNLTKED